MNRALLASQSHVKPLSHSYSALVTLASLLSLEYAQLFLVPDLCTCCSFCLEDNVPPQPFTQPASLILQQKCHLSGIMPHLS